MKNILLDSDVLIEHLRNNNKVTQTLEELYSSSNLACSVISVTEILRGTREKEKLKTEKLLSFLRCVEVDFSIAKKAAEYLALYSKSHAVEMADALIAATAFHHQFELCSFNWKHYPMKELRAFKIER